MEPRKQQDIHSENELLSGPSLLYSSGAKESTISVTFSRRKPKSILGTLDLLEPGLLQTTHHAFRDAAPGSAVQIADVVKQPPAALQDTEKLGIEALRVQLPGQAESRRVVEDAIEGAVFQRLDHLERITDPLLDSGISKQLL